MRIPTTGLLSYSLETGSRWVVLREPHVTELRYRVEFDELLRFSSPEMIERKEPAFDFRLTDGEATFRMKEHHVSSESARKKTDKYMRSYQMLSGLRYDREIMRFELADVKAIDRSPPQGARTGEQSVGFHAETHFPLVRRVSRRESAYPAPPDDFEATDDAEAMWELYERYRAGRDRLLPMAYSCLTRFKYSAGGSNKQAAEKYGVDEKVLTKLSELSTNLGVGTEARKVSRQHYLRDPSSVEVEWIEQVVKALIERICQYASDPGRNWPKITKSQFLLL